MNYDACAQMSIFPGLLLGHEFEGGEYDESCGPMDPLRDFIPIGDVSEEMLDPMRVEDREDYEARVYADDEGDGSYADDPLSALVAREERGENVFDRVPGGRDDEVLDKDYANFSRLQCMGGIAGDENLRVSHGTRRIPDSMRDPDGWCYKTPHELGRERRALRRLKKERRATIRGAIVRDHWVYDIVFQKEHLLFSEVTPRDPR